MGHRRAHRVNPRPPGEPTIEQLNGELAEASRRIAQYAAIIAYHENELEMLRKSIRVRQSICKDCTARFKGRQHGDCGDALIGSQ